MLIAFAQWVQLPSSFMLLNSCSFAPSNNTNCKTFKNIEAMMKIPDETEPPFRSKLNHLLTGGFVIQI